MESQLRPEIQQITILETEIEKVNRLLQIRKQTLEEIRVNSKAQRDVAKGERGNVSFFFFLSFFLWKGKFINI